MGITSVKPSGSFIARDNHGREYEIFVFHQPGELGSSGDRNSAKRRGRLKTARGQEVRRIAQGRYEIIVESEPPIPVKSADSNAP